MLKKKQTISFVKRPTPIQGSGVYNKEVKALPIPPARKESESISPDSTPTPQIDLGWRTIADRLDIMEDEFKNQYLKFQRHPVKMNLKLARLCADCADDCQRIKGRVMNWPNLTGASLAGERPWVINKYLDLIQELANLKAL